jgi:TRAP-type C4-dicarboxylate transport system permease large subunit
MFLAILQLGFFTPPLGMNLFISSYRFNTPVLDVVRACAPFFVIMLFSVLVITFWPQLSLVLVR